MFHNIFIWQKPVRNRGTLFNINTLHQVFVKTFIIQEIITEMKIRYFQNLTLLLHKSLPNVFPCDYNDPRLLYDRQLIFPSLWQIS